MNLADLEEVAMLSLTRTLTKLERERFADSLSAIAADIKKGAGGDSRHFTIAIEREWGDASYSPPTPCGCRYWPGCACPDEGGGG
jgi:hypothetical protein